MKYFAVHMDAHCVKYEKINDKLHLEAQQYKVNLNLSGNCTNHKHIKG